jgi:acyl-CoA thioester hydrolase
VSAPAAPPAFAWPIRVYWEDTDAGGVVYHAGYLRFLERARTEWLRAHGIEQSLLARELGIVFAVTELSLRFRGPARLDDGLLATCVLEQRGGASLEFSQELVRPVDNARLVDARVRAACLDAARFKPRPIPKDLFTAFPEHAG